MVNYVKAFKAGVGKAVRGLKMAPRAGIKAMPQPVAYKAMPVPKAYRAITKPRR